jgi:chemotaxis protein MotB
MAGKGGGSWKVAYADFVTAMMAFFLVMWILAQNKPLKKAIAEYFNDPWKISRKPMGDGPGGASLVPGKQMDEPSGASVRAGHSSGGDRNRPNPRLRGFASSNTVGKADKDQDTNPADRPSLFFVHANDNHCAGAIVLFPEDSTELDQASQDRLRRLVVEIRGLPNKIEIRGHATRCPTTADGPPQDAWGLSYARCQTAMKFLEQQGIDPARIRLSQGGPFEPYSMGNAEKKRTFNSRVEVYMLSEYAEDLMGTPEERARRLAEP